MALSDSPVVLEEGHLIKSLIIINKLIKVHKLWILKFENLLISSINTNSCADQRDSENVSDNDHLSSSDCEESKLTEDIDEDELAVGRLSWKPTGGPVCLGEWEQHTKVNNHFIGPNSLQVRN